MASNQVVEVVGHAHEAIHATVLIAEDSPLYRRLLEESFSGTGHSLIYAKNGAEALRLYAEHRPEVVISDWTMPDFSGIEVCQRIRAEFSDDHPYIVLLTGNAQKEHVIEGLTAGADDYLTKPFHSGELQARVRVGLRFVTLNKEVLTKNRQLEELALTDPLTGLPNRRAVEIWANRELSAARRHGFSVWVVVADLDHFKCVNDTYGHDAGDLVLARFANVLRTNTRESNMCARLGGEEFLVILTHTKEEQARLVVERIRSDLQSELFGNGSDSYSVTASFGVSELNAKAESTLAGLIAEADRAMYEAKKNGRNRVEFVKD